MLRLHHEDATRGKDREKRQLQAWLVACVSDLLRALGLPGGWWCAVDIPRAELFGDGSSGDVDLLAGPLGFALTEAQWKARVERARLASGANLAMAVADTAAGMDGLVLWPPPIGYTVAVEVKASYYTDRWGATHAGKAEKVLGSLRRRERYGINRVAFLHLGALTPSEDVDDMERRSTEAGRIPQICPPERFERFGYATAVMSVISSGLWGAVEGLRWHSEPQLLTSEVERPWHDSLQRRFAGMQRPRSVRTYVHRCPHCSAWMHAGSSCPDGFCCAECGPANNGRIWTADAVTDEERAQIRRSAGLEPG